MSIAIPRKSISDESAKEIATILQLVPEQKFIPGKKKQFQSNKKTVPMYYKIGDNVHVPFTFGKNYFKVSPPERHTITGLIPTCTLREHQVPKIQEALEYLKLKNTVTLQLDTGFGKTVMSVYLATQLSKITLVLHPGTTFHDQWLNAFRNNTNVGDCLWDVYKKIPKAGVCVIVSTTGMLSHIPQELLDNIGTLIIDETHLMCTPSAIPAILSIKPQYVIGCSYTYEKSDKTHHFMDGILGMHRIKGRLSIVMHAIRLNTPFTYDVPINPKTGVTDYTSLMTMVVNNQERNKFICQLVISNLHRKIMLITPRVEHAQILCEMLVRSGVKADYITGKKPKYENSNVLVGSIDKISTGFDEANYCDTYDGIPSDMLINVGSNKEHNLIVQLAGRLKRSTLTEPYLINIVDDCKIFKNHERERKKIYEEEGYHYYKLDFQIPIIPQPNTNVDE